MSSSSSSMSALLPATEPLPAMGAAGFSLLSFNVLIPNSVDGWWTYKYYKAGAISEECTKWPARVGLMRERLLGSGADVICLQETSPEGFD